MGVFDALRAASRLVLFLGVSLLFAMLYAFTLPLPRRYQLAVQQRWCGAVARIAGLTTVISGAPARDGPVVFLANHVSYFDIPGFGRLVPATFVAKSEVGGWPLIGWFARLTGTIFIPRRASRSAAQVTVLSDRLARGESLILFPEGTNSDGAAVLPFKSSLLQSVQPSTTGISVTVQPVSLAYTRLITGEPLIGDRRGLYAWVGMDDMLPHLWRALAAPGAELRVHFHPPLAGDATDDRKRLAYAAERAVRSGVDQLWETQTEV